MANNYISHKTATDSASAFIRELTSSDPARVIKYVFIGNSNEYANTDTLIPDIVDSQQVEKSVWDTMYAAKKVTGNDVQFVIPRVEWIANTKYHQFDDTIERELLLTYDANTALYPMYVMNSDGNVYKCIFNNLGSPSTVEPFGDFNSSNGFISTIDSYVWKYMYNIRNTSKFLTDDWMPVPSSVNALEYSSDATNLVEGTIASIVVDDSGIGYYEGNVAVEPYTTGTNIIIVANTTYVAENMTVEGGGILPGTYITTVDTINREITLSLPVTSNSNSDITLSTRIVIDGDGSTPPTVLPIISNTVIEQIKVINVGSGYSRANVEIYGTGSNAAARAIISPKFGHGYNSAKELGANHVLVSMKFGDIDSTEGGLISVDTSFRQYGLLSNPHKYNESTPVTANSSNTFISQTLDITLLPGSDFTLNEFVYQGQNEGVATFSGIVHAIESGENIVRLINTKGTPLLGGLLKGSSIARVVSSYKYPELQPYSGDILFVKNIPAINRIDGQAEIIKLIIKF